MRPTAIAATVLFMVLPGLTARAQSLTQRAAGQFNELVLRNESDLGHADIETLALIVSFNAAEGAQEDLEIVREGLAALWIAQPLDALLWDQPMGGPGQDRYTWRQFTGRGFEDLFIPNDPCYGFFVDYRRENGSYVYQQPGLSVPPGAELGGFFFDRSFNAGQFLMAGHVDPSAFVSPVDLSDPPPDLSATLGIDSSAGVVRVLPEPSSIALADLGLVALLMRSRRRAKRQRGPR